MVAMDGETKQVDPVGETPPVAPLALSDERPPSYGDSTVDQRPLSYPEQMTGIVVDSII